MDLDAGPLGPLGANKEDGAMITKMTLEPSPPRPPSKDAAPSVPSSPPMHTYMRASSMDGHRQVSVHEEDLSRAASIPVQVRAPSMPLEQAANPTFYITVGDPHRIGDITSAHTVYKVSTKTTSRAFKTPEFSVSRRYRDFLWLYEQLCKSSPGAIVPPPPEKQAMNRFAENFVESRRFALERMLEKIAKHPILSRDGDFKLFLESESFTTDSKYRERETRSSGESKGFMASVGGAFGASLPFSGKYVEQDEFFDDRKAAFDLLEQQLKSLLRAVDMVVRQRKDLASSTADFGAALSVLSTVELSKSLSNALGSLSDLQLKIKELHERQAQQDLLTLGHTVDEYLRLVASVKGTFETRRKAWTSWQTAESDMQKRKAYADKVRRQTKTQQDRMSQIEAELGEAERKSHALRLEFDNIGKLLKAELLRFDMDKVEDFKTSVEMFLESAVESQKEVCETYIFRKQLTSHRLSNCGKRIVRQSLRKSCKRKMDTPRRSCSIVRRNRPRIAGWKRREMEDLAIQTTIRMDQRSDKIYSPLACLEKTDLIVTN